MAVEVYKKYFLGDYELDPANHLLRRGETPVSLSRKRFQVLLYLVEHQARLVTRDQLLARFWDGSEVYEENLTKCVSEIRKALADQTKPHKFIETVPAVGYRYIGPCAEAPLTPEPSIFAVEKTRGVRVIVEEDETRDSLLSGRDLLTHQLPRETVKAALVAARVRKTWLVTSLLACTLIAIAVAAFFYFNRTPILTERDTILLADFVNTTGDPVFDGTLKRALAVQLEQSPFLNIFSDERVREALRFMGRAPDERVTPELAREICERQGFKALLTGSISTLGSHYIITLEALNGHTGDSLAREQIEAESKEQVLKKLGEAATKLRSKLGESLATIQKFDAPIEQATTSSLEAFKAYSLGFEQRRSGRFLEAIPFFKRAIELDHNFAVAYTRLAAAYIVSGQDASSRELLQKAYELRDRVSQRERFYISETYYNVVTKDLDRRIEENEVWKSTYARDWAPRHNLSTIYTQIGPAEKAVEEASEAIRLDPDDAVPRLSLAIAFMKLNRFDEAKQVIQEALAKRLEIPFMHSLLYSIAFIQRDSAAMKQQVDWAMDRPDEYQAQDWQTRSAEFSGELRKAREFDDHAVELAAQHNFKEITANLITARAVSDATFGVCERTNQTTAKALSLARSKAALLNAAEAFAICGQASQAQSLMDEVSKQFPRDTLLNTVWLPLFRAQLEMHRGKASQASELLEPTRRYELVGGFWPQYLRGQAFLSQRKGTEAAAEFQKILDHRGWYPNSPLYPLAHLGLARALTMTSNVSGGRKAYQDFFAIWKDADADLPILIEARREYRRLQEKRFDSWLEVIVKTYPQALGKQIVFEYNEAVANIWLRKLK